MSRLSLIVLDCHYLCHRAFHVSDLSWQGRATGVLYGFLRSLVSIQDEFSSDRLAFCFEGARHKLLRRKILPTYKDRREEKRTYKDREIVKARSDLEKQIATLRDEILPSVGFKNIFCYPGYESDDIMANIALYTPENEETILVTADHDLFQCLRSNVSIWSPQRQHFVTESWFRRRYHIPPRKWAEVKALAGCHSDNVPGVGGIGETSALKWLRGELRGQMTEKITCKASREIARRNRALVQLPFEGCPVPEIQRDHFKRKAWNRVCDKLGMKTLRK
jgi:DNA polymerase I